MSIPRRPVGGYLVASSGTDLPNSDINLVSMPSHSLLSTDQTESNSEPATPAPLPQQGSITEHDGAPLLQTHGEAVSGWHRTRRTLRAWWLECLCCVLTIGLFAGLVSMLARYQGEPVPQWPLDLPLSTVVAIIATLCRALMVFPVSEGLAQLKWHWFRGTRTRPVNDLYMFDQATRGPLGAVLLLFGLRGRWVKR